MLLVLFLMFFLALPVKLFFELFIPGLVFGLESLRAPSFGIITKFPLLISFIVSPLAKAFLNFSGIGPSVRLSHLNESSGGAGMDAFFMLFLRALGLRVEAATKSWLPRQRKKNKMVFFI